MLAILHGSRVTHNAHYGSDWDVGVLSDHPLTVDERSALKRVFGAKFHVPDEMVDIADLGSESPLLRYRVAMNGKLIEGDEGDFRRFQVRAWKDYLNNDKIFDLRARFLAKHLN